MFYYSLNYSTPQYIGKIYGNFPVTQTATTQVTLTLPSVVKEIRTEPSRQQTTASYSSGYNIF